MKLLKIDKTYLTPSTFVGLGLPLIGMPLWNLIASSSLVQSFERLHRAVIGSMVTVAMAIGVIAVVLLWEKKTWSALGIHRQTRRSIIFALSASIIIAVAGTLISLGIIRLFSLPMPTLTTERITAFPLWFAIWVVISSSIAEEVLYRGFVLERLGQVTGSIWIGGLITLIWFLAMHWSFGLVYILAIGLPTSLLITLLYIWRRDLIATSIVHFVFNAPVIAAALLFSLAR